MRTISLLGGTGREGRGLGLRFALAGERVVIGSRNADRATSVARQLRKMLGDQGAAIVGTTNAEAARDADAACICLPTAGLAGVLAEAASALRGKQVIEVVNPVERTPEGFRLAPLQAPSAAEYVAQLLPEAHVVSAFQTLAAGHLLDISSRLEGDCFVCGDAPQAKELVFDLIGRMPNLRAIDAGPRHNARHIEAATVLLLEINRIYGTTSSLQVVGLDTAPPD